MHEAVCAERYKALDLKMMVLMAMNGAVLVAMLGGNPVARTIQQIFGGH